MGNSARQWLPLELSLPSAWFCGTSRFLANDPPRNGPRFGKIAAQRAIWQLDVCATCKPLAASSPESHLLDQLPTAGSPSIGLFLRAQLMGNSANSRPGPSPVRLVLPCPFVHSRCFGVLPMPEPACFTRSLSEDSGIWRVLCTADVGKVQGQGVLDLQVLHIGGVQHFQAFCHLRENKGGRALWSLNRAAHRRRWRQQHTKHSTASSQTFGGTTSNGGNPWCRDRCTPHQYARATYSEEGEVQHKDRYRLRVH